MVTSFLCHGLDLECPRVQGLERRTSVGCALPILVTPPCTPGSPNHILPPPWDDLHVTHPLGSKFYRRWCLSELDSWAWFLRPHLTSTKVLQRFCYWPRVSSCNWRAKLRLRSFTNKTWVLTIWISTSFYSFSSLSLQVTVETLDWCEPCGSDCIFHEKAGPLCLPTGRHMLTTHIMNRLSGQHGLGLMWLPDYILFIILQDFIVCLNCSVVIHVHYKIYREYCFLS